MRKSLTREERLRKSRDIRELFSSGARIDARGLRLLHRVNRGRSTRFAVVVARGSGSAVRRNREKRITREAYRMLKGSLAPGHDLVFLVTRFGASLSDRQAAMAHLLGRAGLRDTAG